MVKIVKGLRDLKILAKHYLIDDKVQFNVNNNKRNVIKIDSSASSGSEFDLGIDQETFKCKHEINPSIQDQ